jgi:hypothetical protein
MSTPAMRAFLESEKVNKKKTIVFSGFYRDKNATTNFLYCNTEMGLKGKKTFYSYTLGMKLFAFRDGCKDTKNKPEEL